MEDSRRTVLTLQETSKEGSEGSSPLPFAEDVAGQTKRNEDYGTRVASCRDSGKECGRNEQKQLSPASFSPVPQSTPGGFILK